MTFSKTPFNTRSVARTSRGARTLTTVCALAVLIGLLLSGCAGGAPKDKDTELTGTTESRILEDEEAPVAGAGAIRGRVVDDLGLPVADATVSLLGTPYSAQSDSNGSFGFSNVTPGRLTLRVAAGNVYRVHEGQVDVAADLVTEVTITLVPQDNRGPGYRPHVHDYWGTDTEVLLIDDDYDVSQQGTWSNYGPAGTAYVSAQSAYNSNWFWPMPIPSDRGDGRPPTVLPGTKEIRITLNWGDDVDIDAFIIGYKTATSTTETRLDAQGNGQERILTLSPGDEDNGHQSFSLWSFTLRPVVRSVPPATTLGSIHATFLLVKGDGVPVEPVHRDFWNGSDQLLLRDYALPARTGTHYVGGCGESQLFLGAADTLVPPGTSRMTMRLGWHANASTLGGTPGDGTYRLLWKPANLGPSSPISDYQTAEPTRPTATTALYDVPIQSSQTDAYYQAKTNWIFVPDRTDMPGVCATNWEYGTDWNLEVIAYKDPGFT